MTLEPQTIQRFFLALLIRFPTRASRPEPYSYTHHSFGPASRPTGSCTLLPVGPSHHHGNLPAGLQAEGQLDGPSDQDRPLDGQHHRLSQAVMLALKGAILVRGTVQLSRCP